MTNELEQVKEELAIQRTAIENMAGYLDNFDITLNNHMVEYNKQQASITGDMAELRSNFSLALKILVPFICIGITGLTGLGIALVVKYVTGG